MADQMNFSTGLVGAPPAQSATQVAGGLAAVDATNTNTALDQQKLNANLPAAAVASTQATTAGTELDNQTKQLALNNRMAMNKGMQAALQNWTANNKSVSDPNNAPALPMGVDPSYTKDTVHNTWKTSEGVPVDMTSPDAPISLPDGSPNTLNPSWITKMYDSAIAQAPSTGASVADIQAAKLQALESAQTYHQKYVETYKAQQDALLAKANADNKTQETSKLAANNLLDGTYVLTHNADGTPKTVPQLEAAWGGAGANPLQKSMAKQFGLDLTKPLVGQMVTTPNGPVPAQQFLQNLAQGSPKGLEIKGKVAEIAAKNTETSLAPLKVAVDQGKVSAEIGGKVETTVKDATASLALRDQAKELSNQLDLLSYMRQHNNGPTTVGTFINSLPPGMVTSPLKTWIQNNARDGKIDYNSVAKAVQDGAGGFDITLQSAGGSKISSGSDARMEGIIHSAGFTDPNMNDATFAENKRITQQYLARADSFAGEKVDFANQQLNFYRQNLEKANPGSGKLVPTLPSSSAFQKSTKNPLIPEPPVKDTNGVPAKVDTTAPASKGAASQADVAALAKRDGVSVERAAAHLKSLGYTVGQ